MPEDVKQFAEKESRLRKKNFKDKYPSIDSWIEHLVLESNKRPFRACELEWFLGIDVKRDVVKSVPDGYLVSNGYAINSHNYAMFIGEDNRLYVFERGSKGTGDSFVLKKDFKRFNKSILSDNYNSRDLNPPAVQYYN